MMGLAAFLLIAVLAVLTTGTARAGVGGSATPDIAEPITIGDTGVTASVEFTAALTDDNADDTFRLTTMAGHLSCNTLSNPCNAPEGNIFDASATGTGADACLGITFNITEVNDALTFTPNPAQNINLLHGETCRINFTVDVVGVPADGATRFVAFMDGFSVEDPVEDGSAIGSDTLVVQLLDLEPTKTADGASTITYRWDIDKTATPDWKLFDGDTGTSTYTVAVTKTLASETNTVTGEITIVNPSPAPISVTVTDLIDGLDPGTVDCDGDNMVTIAADDDVVCSYEATGLDGDEVQNVATVTITDGGDFFNQVSYQAVSAITWGTPEAVLDSITVTDTNPEFGGPKVATDSTSWDYEITFDCEGVQYVNGFATYTHPNTAEIEETGQTDDADVTVDCYQLSIAKTADTDFDRDYDWTITKDVDGNSTMTVPASTTEATFSYDVVVSILGMTDSNWAASGDVIITNPNPDRAAELTELVDTISVGINATLNCDWAEEGIVPAAGSVTCTYDEALPDGTNRVNTATATQQNYAFDHTDPPVESGTTDYTDTANITFGAPTNVTDDCVSVDDDPNGVLDSELCVGDAPETYSYQITWQLDPQAPCGVPQEFINTASFLTNDQDGEADDTGSDNAAVSVTVECLGLEGCTPGFWKTHSSFAPGGQDDLWVGLTAIQDFDTTFGVNWFTPDQTLQQIMEKPGGLRTLAFHIIAAQLNINSPDVDYGYTQAQLDALIDGVDPNNKASVSNAISILTELNEAGCPDAGTFTVPD